MNDAAISEIVGSLLLAALLVVAASTFTVLMMQRSAPDDNFLVELVPEANATAISLHHGGGRPIHAPVTTVHVTVDGYDTTVPLAAFGSQVGPTWEPGETLCLAGPASSCSDLFAGQQVTSVRLVVADKVVYEWSGQVQASTAIAALGGPDPHAPDLVAEIVRVFPAVPNATDLATFTARITNQGTADLPASTPIAVDFMVDGAPVSSHVITGGLLPFESKEVTSTGAFYPAGAHLAQAIADPADLIPELYETNNVGSKSFTIAGFSTFDPGHAYEDVDCDGVYTPGVDVPLPDSVVTDGTHTVLHPTHGLIIPPSVGRINGGALNHFEAGTSCHLLLGTEFRADSSDTSLIAGTDIILLGDVRADGTDLTITASGDILIAGSVITNGASTLVVDAGGAIVVLASHITCDMADLSFMAADSVRIDGTTLWCDRATVRIEAGASWAFTNGTYKNTQGTHEFLAAGDVDLRGSLFRAQGSSLVFNTDTAARTIHVDGASLRDANNKAKVAPNGVLIDGTPAFGKIDYVG